MATVADVKKSLAPKTDPDKPGTLAKLIDQMRPEIARALPKHMDPDRMARVALTLVRQTPQLAQVVPETFLGALMTCSQLGLEPGPLGHAWIIPRKNTDDDGNRFWEANFQLGYKGILELARRSGQVAKIVARTVFAEEMRLGQFTAGYEGADDIIKHTPILTGDAGAAVLFYGVAKLTNNELYTAFLTPDEVNERHRKRSSAYNSPAWRNDLEAMSWKSCVVELRRWLPQSPELEAALAMDGQVRTDISPDAMDDAAARAAMVFDGEVIEDDAEQSDAGRRQGATDQIVALFEATPLDDDEARSRYVADTIGREVKGLGELTDGERAKLVEKLTAYAAKSEPPADGAK